MLGRGEEEPETLDMPFSRAQHPLTFNHHDGIRAWGGPGQDPALAVELVKGEVEEAGHGGRLSVGNPTRRRCNPRHNGGRGVKEAVLTYLPTLAYPYPLLFLGFRAIFCTRFENSFSKLLQ